MIVTSSGHPFKKKMKKRRKSQEESSQFYANVDDFPKQTALGPDAYKLLKWVT